MPLMIKAAIDKASYLFRFFSYSGLSLQSFRPVVLFCLLSPFLVPFVVQIVIQTEKAFSAAR